MITATKYAPGMSAKLDRILSHGDARNAWAVRNGRQAPEILIARTAADAVRAYANVLRMRGTL